jgi:ketosteroid isomerase-like protein
MTQQDKDSEAIQALKRFYAAEEHYVISGAKDFSIIAETLHPEVVMHQAAALPYGGDWRGHDGFEAWMKAMTSMWSKLEHHDVRIFDAGQDTVFTRARAVVTLRATGEEITFPILHQVTVKDGKIFRAEPFYWDTATLLATISKSGVGADT